MFRSYLAVALLATISQPASATRDTLVSETAAFIDKYLVGNDIKTIRKDMPLDNGKSVTDFASQTNFSGVLTEGEKAFTFTFTSNIQQMVWDVDSNGARKEPGRNKDRVFVSSCEFKKPLSPTPDTFLTGFCRGIVNTLPNTTVLGGSTMGVIATFDGKSLKFIRSTVGLADCFAAEDKSYACQTEETQTYELIDTPRGDTFGKAIRYTTSQRVWPFDAVTLTRGKELKPSTAEPVDLPKAFE